MLVEKWIALAFEMYILILVVVGLRQISYELFIASIVLRYYRQLSKDSRSENYVINSSFVCPERQKAQCNKNGIDIIFLVFVDNLAILRYYT